MKESDFEYICWLASPEYIMPKAIKHGLEIAQLIHPNLVEEALENKNILAILGARGAAVESRNNIRSYLRYVRHRDNIKVIDLKLAQAMRRAGWVGSYQPVEPLIPITRWRDNTRYIWPKGNGIITNRVLVKVPKERSRRDKDIAVIKAVSDMLVENSSMNRAILQGYPWQRTTGHVMINLEPSREQIRTVLIDASDLTFKETSRKLTTCVRSLIKAERSYPEEVQVVDELFKRWCKVGTISSPAGAMLSLVGAKLGIGSEGQLALLSNINGIGLGVTAGLLDDETIVLWASFDHRLFDADHEGIFRDNMVLKIPKLLEED